MKTYEATHNHRDLAVKELIKELDWAEKTLELVPVVGLFE